MKRRTFLSALVAVPFMGSLLKPKSVIPPSPTVGCLSSWKIDCMTDSSKQATNDDLKETCRKICEHIDQNEPCLPDWVIYDPDKVMKIFD